MIFHPTQQRLPLGLGGAALGNLFTAISDDDAQAVIRAALADGCRTFDTAPHYGNGLSEHRMGHTLRSHERNSFVLSTKVGRVLVPDEAAPREQNSYVDGLPYHQTWDYSAAGVRRSVEDSLQRLGLARLDVVYVHDCDAATHGARYPQVLQTLATSGLPELHRLKAEGLVRHIGLGVNDVAVCLDVLALADLDCLLLAGRYSLIDHSALLELLPLCAKRGVQIALGGVFNSGILATGVRGSQPFRFNYSEASLDWVTRVAAVETICDEFNVPLRAAAMQFPLGHPAIKIVMAGPQTVAHWQDAVCMLSCTIPTEFWNALRARGLLPDETPTPA